VTRWTIDGLRARNGTFELGTIDLSLEPGGAIAVLGRSGAGKTTFLRALAGFLPVSAGRLLRDGSDVTREDPERRGVGYVPQGLGLFPHRSVERNVSFPLEVRGRTDAGARSREILGRFGLSELARRLPGSLSGGEAQRVALARAIAAEPELVLWDEPWQALDVEARAALLEVLRELREELRLPVLLVTHEPTLAFSVADRFLVLDQGAPSFHGSPADLLDRPVDPFTARFVGFENIYEPGALADGPTASLASWLRERSGAAGVAVPCPRPAAAGAWEGTVRTARPGPDGGAVRVRSGPLTVELRTGAGSPLPTAGERVRFDVDPKSVRALRGTGGGSPP
jgi:ABC-type Fe3+/spermidine/putrescine transport system ATPase subunit